MDAPAFDEAFVRKLERLEIVLRRPRGGIAIGRRRTRRTGRGLDFSDHRPFVPGDDPRHVDWHLFARFDRPIVRLFEEESAGAVHVLVDGSASMRFGDPSKLTTAARLAAALAYVGLVHHDRVSVGVLTEGAVELVGPYSGPQTFGRFTAMMAKTRAHGTTDLTSSMAAFLRRRPPRGLVVVLSDFHDAGGVERGLGRVLRAGHELALVSFVAPTEVAPELPQGEVVLRDAETGLETRLDLTSDVVARYHARLTARRDALTRWGRARGVRVVHASSSTPFEALALETLRARGILR